ncbi:MAG: BlaI/MecI/CopY family transcriptional regulator [Planctomycetota bacterium]|nr:BlaI/MecI/CopY family transcriptional regulator [Planctomycetota bacterium]
MTDRPGLSKGEMEVARVLWSLGSASVRQVHEAFPPDREIDFATVQTYLRRLETKGYVTGEIQGRTRVYTPCVQPQSVIRESIHDFVDRLFGGETLPLVRQLIEEGDVSTDELAELRRLITRLEKQRKPEVQ